MEKARAFFRTNPQLWVVVIIAFLSFLTFRILFRAAASDDYLREIIAALIGTLLAAVVTTVLLNNQTKQQEGKERNVEVFKKRLAAYDRFIKTSVDALKDHEISIDEITELKKQIYYMSMMSSDDTIEAVVAFVRTHLLGDMDAGDIKDVIASFRSELNLGVSHEYTGSELQAIENLHRLGFDNLPAMKVIKEAFDRIYATVSEGVTLRAGDDMPLFDPPQGILDAISFHIVASDQVTYYVAAVYPAEKGFTGIDVSLTIGMEDAKAARAAEVEKLARDRGFKRPIQPETGKEDLDEDLEKTFVMKCSRDQSGTLTINLGPLPKRIIAEIEAIDQRPS